MTTLQWSEIVELDADTLEQETLEDLEAVGFTGTSWQEGDPSPALVRGVAERDVRISRYIVGIKEAVFNPTASGESLTRLSLGRFENTRNASTTAQRTITLACSATEGPHNLDVGDVVIEDADGHTVRNVEGLSVVYPVTLPSGGEVTLLFEAEEPGTAANLAADSYTSLVTSITGVTITADVPTRDGTDEEADERLRERNSTAIATHSLEPIADTIENLALEAAPTVAQVAIDDENPRGAGTFDVYLAGELATAPTADVDAVQAALDLRVMGDPTLPADERRGYAQPAPELELDITGTVYFEPEFSEAEVTTAVELALIAFIKTIPLGGFDVSASIFDIVPLNDIERAAENTTINGVSCVRHFVMTVPAANVAVGSFQKVTIGTWTLTYAPAL